MKTLPLIVCVLSALLLTSGCHPISVKTGYDRGANFAGRRTYAWNETAKFDTGDPRFDTKPIARAIRSTAEAMLATKGFQKTDSANPGFLVGYAADIESGTSTVANRRVFGNSSLGWVRKESNTVDYETGALLLQMTDPTTKQVLWEAVASAVIVDRATAAERQERVAKAVRKMLDDFPPQ